MRFLLAVCIVCLFAVAVQAQEQDFSPANTCNDSQVAAFVSELTEMLPDQAQAGDFFQLLDALQAKIATQRWQCSGMTLSGDKEPGKKSVILGPLTFEPGVYRVTTMTDGGLYLSFAPVEGYCDMSLYIEPGDATNGTEQIFRADDGCTALIQVETDTAWTMTFAPVTGGN